MGVIKRQSFKFSIISFIGVAIGVYSTIYIYPHATKMVGLYRALYDASVLVSIFVLLGSPTAAIRFFPKYRDESSGHKGFLTWLLMVASLGFLGYLLLFPVVNQLLIKWVFREENSIYEDFIVYIIPLTFCIALTNLLARYISNFQRIVIPSIFETLGIKIGLPVIMLMYLNGWLNAEEIVIGIIITFALGTVGMIIYLISLGQLKLTRPEILNDPKGWKEYKSFSLYSIFSVLGSQIAFKIDGLFVAGMINFTAGGVYTIAWAITDVISKPIRALSAITGPMIARYLEEGNLSEVKSLYRKSSLNMTIVGLGIFLLIWTALPYIFDIMPNSEAMREGTYVVLFLGLAQLWDMMTGVNNEIIYYSKYYRFNLFLTLFLAGTNIIANWLLIPQYGMIGAAIAACLSFFLYNLVKLIFIYVKFGFQPISSRIIPVVAFGVGAWILSAWLPAVDSPYITMIYKGALFSILYGLAIWKFNISSDINQWIAMALGKVSNLLNKQ